MAFLLEWGHRHVGRSILWLGCQNHLLDVHPAHVFCSQTLLLVSLGLCVLQEQHTDEKVEEEEGANQDERYEVEHHGLRVLFSRAELLSGLVHCLLHDIRPTFQTGHNVKCVHSLKHCVEVVVPSAPLTLNQQALLLCLDLIKINAAVEEVAAKEVYADDGKQEVHYSYNYQYVENMTH